MKKCGGGMGEWKSVLGCGRGEGKGIWGGVRKARGDGGCKKVCVGGEGRGMWGVGVGKGR